MKSLFPPSPPGPSPWWLGRLIKAAGNPTCGVCHVPLRKNNTEQIVRFCSPSHRRARHNRKWA